MDSVSGEWTGFSEEDLRGIRTQAATDHFTLGDISRQTTGLQTSVVTSSDSATPAFRSKKAKNKKSSLTSDSAKCSVKTRLADPQPSTPSKSVGLHVTVMAAESTSANESSLQRFKSIPTTDDDLAVAAAASSRRRQHQHQHPAGRTAVNGTVTLRVKEDGRAVELVNDDSKQDESHVDVDDGSVADDQLVSSESASEFENFVGGCDEHNRVTRINKKVSLEEFQLKQKMIEEQNKWRRAMLTKAIADRKRKTLAETEKLTHIQAELQKLDSLVSNDVAILRNQIEVASVEFNEIQKRYEKAEREFVEAKVDLFRKMERKEKLTEHLCKIIEENELRKAKKLSDLMDELELESLRDDECMADNGDAILPQLCAFNDITYAYCTTFRQPSSPSSSMPPPVDESEVSSEQPINHADDSNRNQPLEGGEKWAQNQIRTSV